METTAHTSVLEEGVAIVGRGWACGKAARGGACHPERSDVSS
jgi:hypothetical protein